MGHKEKILEYIAKHPGCTSNEVARAIERSRDIASIYLRKLVEAGVLVRKSAQAENAWGRKITIWRYYKK